MQGLLDRRFIVQTFLQVSKMHLLDAIGPQPLLKVHRIHFNDVLKTHRDRGFFLFLFFFLSLVAVHTQQGACTHHLISAVQMEIFQRTSRFRAILYLIENKTSFTWLNLQIGQGCCDAHDDGVNL